MLTYSKLVKKPGIFRTFTGLTVEEFDDLYAKIESKYLGFMLLVYYRLYVTYCLSGFLFNLDQSNIYRNIKHLEPVQGRKRCIQSRHR